MPSDVGIQRGDTLPVAPMMAIALCILVLSMASNSISTYMGVYVQELLGLPSPDMAGEGTVLLVFHRHRC